MQISTTCPYCGVGCGVSVELGDDASLPLVSPSQEHPANKGRICSKGSALTETLDKRLSPTRLEQPVVDGHECDWSHATQEIANRIQHCLDEHGPNSVAFYLSGQLLTEDYYVANKFAKGFLGCANVDTNSRLCMSSAVAAYKRAFGSDTVPCNYEDLEQADLLVLIGSNAAWTHPVLYQRMVQAKQDNPNLTVVLIDPRKTATADLADLHLAIKPSSDNFLFQGLLKFLIDVDAVDHEYIEHNTEGFEDVTSSVSDLTLPSVAQRCGVSEADLKAFYEAFAATEKTVSFYSQGINQSATGTDKCNAIINCHIATGKLGYPGAGPFSITGQPNAMGGREVGGLANMLAAHMDFNDVHIDRVKRFWNAKTMAQQPGLKAIDMFSEIEQGEIKLVWIMATNPAVSLPNSESIRRALSQCETVIVSDVTQTDTTAFADILLPAMAWGEKDGTVTNSERRISRQRGFLEPPGVASADWWAIAEVAKKMGFDKAFNYRSAHEIFAEHAALSAFENDGQRDFDLSGLMNLSASDYDALEPIQWPVNSDNPNGSKRMFADGRFFTATGKAQFIVSTPAVANSALQLADRSLLLNTGRLRDQWHTMTRTGAVPRLSGHDDIATVQISPKDALERGLAHNSMATLSNELGEARFMIKVDSSMNVGNVFAPIHWNGQFANQAVINQLIPSLVDPVSGQPEFKATEVSVQPLLARSWARVVTTRPLENLEDFIYWSRASFGSGSVYLLGLAESENWRTRLSPSADASFIEYSNPIQHSSTLVVCQEEDIVALVFEHECASQLPSYPWLVNLFENTNPERAAAALRGEADGQDALICACFGTTRKTITAAVEQGITSVPELAQHLGCGSKCGSCKPELSSLFKQASGE